MMVWILGWALVTAAAIVALVVTIQNLRSARGPAERRFVLGTCLAFWIVSFGCLGLAAVLHAPWRYAIVAAYVVGVTPAVYWASTRRQLLRRAEDLRRRGIIE